MSKETRTTFFSFLPFSHIFCLCVRFVPTWFFFTWKLVNLPMLSLPYFIFLNFPLAAAAFFCLQKPKHSIIIIGDWVCNYIGELLIINGKFSFLFARSTLILGQLVVVVMVVGGCCAGINYLANIPERYRPKNIGLLWLKRHTVPRTPRQISMLDDWTVLIWRWSISKIPTQLWNLKQTSIRLDWI